MGKLDAAARMSFRLPRAVTRFHGRRKEIALESSSRFNGNRCSWRGSFGVARLLAPQNELARSFSRTFLSGLPGLRNQAAIRREVFLRVRALQLRSQQANFLGLGSTRQNRRRRIGSATSSLIFGIHRESDPKIPLLHFRGVGSAMNEYSFNGPKRRRSA